MGAINNLAPTDGTGGTAGSFKLDFCDDSMAGISGASGASAVTPSATPTSTTSFQTTLPLATIADAKWLVLYGALPGETTQNWKMPNASTHPIPHWYWADNTRKNNFVLMEWNMDYRTAGEAARLAGMNNCAGTPLTGSGLHGGPYTASSQLYNSDDSANYGYSLGTINDKCKSFRPDQPWLIVLSPNASDTPPAGAGVAFDLDTCILDERYGTKNQMDVSQAALDPLFEMPMDCGGMDEDGNPIPRPVPGTCIPYYEARGILPHATGATTPPDNGAGAAQDEPVTLLADYTLVSAKLSATGNVAYPPLSLDMVATDHDASQPACVIIPTGKFDGC
jgi:hypothetical protein